MKRQWSQDSLSGTIGAARSAFVRRAARATSVIAATPRAPVTAVALIIVVSREAARRPPFFGPHLIRGYERESCSEHSAERHRRRQTPVVFSAAWGSRTSNTGAYKRDKTDRHLLFLSPWANWISICRPQTHFRSRLWRASSASRTSSNVLMLLRLSVLKTHRHTG